MNDKPKSRHAVALGTLGGKAGTGKAKARSHEQALLWTAVALATANLLCLLWLEVRPASPRPPGSDASTIWWSEADASYPPERGTRTEYGVQGTESE